MDKLIIGAVLVLLIVGAGVLMLPLLKEAKGNITAPKKEETISSEPEAVEQLMLNPPTEFKVYVGSTEGNISDIRERGDGLYMRLIETGSDESTINSGFDASIIFDVDGAADNLQLEAGYLNEDEEEFKVYVKDKSKGWRLLGNIPVTGKRWVREKVDICDTREDCELYTFDNKVYVRIGRAANYGGIDELLLDWISLKEVHKIE